MVKRAGHVPKKKRAMNMHAMAPLLLSTKYIFNPVVHKLLSDNEGTKEQMPENS